MRLFKKILQNKLSSQKHMIIDGTYTLEVSGSQIQYHANTAVHVEINANTTERKTNTENYFNLDEQQSNHLINAKFLPLFTLSIN